MEYTTPTGLVVHDRRVRAFPRDVDANGNDPIGTVGPDVPAGYGDTHVMYDGAGIPPPMVQAWAGWPVEWATPTWGSMVGLGEITRRVSTVFAAIDKNAWITSDMRPYRTRGTEIAGRLGWMWNPQPEVYTGWREFWRQAWMSFQGSGEVFLWATSRWESTRAVKTFVMLNPGWVSVELDGTVRRYFLGGKDITDDVLHIRYASWPSDARGHGPLEAASNAMFGAAALERYAAQLAVRGGVPWAVLSAGTARLTANQATALQQQYVAARMSAMGAPAVLSGGLELTPVNVSPRDMALLELRQFDEARLAVILGVPPVMLGLPSGADTLTYQNVEEMYVHHWRATLKPLSGMMMEAITQWALANRDEAVHLDADEYTRPSWTERVSGYATLHGIVETDADGNERRAISVDEIRAAEEFDSTDELAAASTSLAVPG